MYALPISASLGYSFMYSESSLRHFSYLWISLYVAASRKRIFFCSSGENTPFLCRAALKTEQSFSFLTNAVSVDVSAMQWMWHWIALRQALACCGCAGYC